MQMNDKGKVVCHRMLSGYRRGNPSAGDNEDDCEGDQVSLEEEFKNIDSVKWQLAGSGLGGTQAEPEKYWLEDMKSKWGTDIMMNMINISCFFHKLLGGY